MSSPFSTSHNRRSRASSQRRDSYLRRFKLLRYHEIMRLCDVMETEVPIHGTGTFPTLKIRPSRLVQLVREKLESVGVKVRDVRLNGSAATHVLSDDIAPSYKDLDIIFTIDFADDDVFDKSRIEPTHSNTAYCSRPSKFRREFHKPAFNFDGVDPEKLGLDDTPSVDDSGYVSSESSVGGDTPFLLKQSSKQNNMKVRKKFHRSDSVEGLPSFSSLSSRFSSVDVQKFPPYQLYLPDYHNWQEIKDTTMDVLLEFLPDEMCRNFSCTSSILLGNVYVRKMVKVLKDSDRWSLISLNNNSGRNIELKFVQNMKRQFEFSVDSFQILLDTYLAFHHAAAIDNQVQISHCFHPTVIAESVYGDFRAALRHLRHRRICTYRPEEIRGGGLLRYCNLLARDFIPGDCDESSGAGLATEEEIARLEKHMCARFFIDFGDIEQQRRKLISFLENHFQGEDDLKFQYLLVLLHVVDSNSACLMEHGRLMILGLITILVRQTLAYNLAGYLGRLAQVSHYKQNTDQNCNENYCRNKSRDNSIAPYSCLHQVETSSVSSYFDSHLVSSSNPVFYSCNKADQISKSINLTFQPDIGPRSSYSWCRCTCCGNYYYFSSSDAGNGSQGFISPVHPICYNSDSVTCYYSPASYNRNKF